MYLISNTFGKGECISHLAVVALLSLSKTHASSARSPLDCNDDCYLARAFSMLHQAGFALVLLFMAPPAASKNRPACVISIVTPGVEYSGNQGSCQANAGAGKEHT